MYSPNVLCSPLLNIYNDADKTHGIGTLGDLKVKYSAGLNVILVQATSFGCKLFLVMIQFKETKKKKKKPSTPTYSIFTIFIAPNKKISKWLQKNMKE